MMRQAPTPHSVSGDAPGCGRPLRRLRTGGIWLLLTLTLIACLLSQIASAQDPSIRLPAAPSSKSAFPKKPGGILGPMPKIDRAQPI